MRCEIILIPFKAVSGEPVFFTGKDVKIVAEGFTGPWHAEHWANFKAAELSAAARVPYYVSNVTEIRGLDVHGKPIVGDIICLACPEYYNEFVEIVTCDLCEVGSDDNS